MGTVLAYLFIGWLVYLLVSIIYNIIVNGH